MKMTKSSKGIKTVFKDIQFLEREIEAEAEELYEHFNATRQELLTQARAELELREGKQAKKIWCGLNLSVRVFNASIQITWYTLHINARTKKKQFISLPKGAGDAYDLRRLKPHANAFEWELVKETEREAATIRASWKRVVEARNQLRYIYQSLDDE